MAKDVNFIGGRSYIRVNQQDINNIDDILTELKIYVSKASLQDLRKSAAYIAKDAKLTAPVKTGFLKGSIFFDEDLGGVYIEAPADYASYVEFGTSKQKPQPYFYSAAYKEFPKLLKKIKMKLNKIVK
jgi:HK97 gp10 family phage protein